MNEISQGTMINLFFVIGLIFSIFFVYWVGNLLHIGKKGKKQ